MYSPRSRRRATPLQPYATTARCSCRGRAAGRTRPSSGTCSAYRRYRMLYLHGAQDGCQLPEIAARAGEVLTGPSRAEVVPGAGHFLHLERPDVVNARIAEFLGRP
jgi:pimeloyl-ACP methyl ester carboxylesterase